MLSPKFCLYPVSGIIIGFSLASTSVAFAGDLELKRVLLSQGGVGYFEYEANVSGDVSLPLGLPRDQMDDILKSIVVFDSKGKVGGIRVAGENPLNASFKDLPFNQYELSSPARLLNALQGEEIKVTGPKEMTGRIVQALETDADLKEKGGLGLMEGKTRISLLTSKGLQQFVFEEAESVAFTDKKLDSQMRRALDLLAQNNRAERRTLHISSEGSGSRTVTVGFLMEMPLWKTTYRLTLGDNDKGYMQGWALFENMSGQDWKDVDLTLTSGNSVTFRQAIYQSYYVDRQTVPVDMLSRVMPRTDQGGMMADAAESAAMNFSKRSGVASAPAMAPAPYAKGSSDVATGETATQVTFHFPRPVTVPSGESFSIPIIDGEVPATRIALYQPGTSFDHPVMSADIKNTSPTALPGGAVALYGRTGQGDITYLGDALLNGMPRGDSRMLSYAMDSGTIIDRRDGNTSYSANGRIANGVFYYSTVHQQTTYYQIKAADGEGRSVMLEHPRIRGYDLTSPDTRNIQLSGDYYRIPVSLKGGEQKSVKVVLERPVAQSVGLAKITDAQFNAFVSDGKLEPSLVTTLKKIRDLKSNVDQAERDMTTLGANRKSLFEDQERLRQNLASVSGDSNLYQRYTRKLAEQEDKIDQLESKISASQNRLETARQALNDYIANLKI